MSIHTHFSWNGFSFLTIICAILQVLLLNNLPLLHEVGSVLVLFQYSLFFWRNDTSINKTPGGDYAC